MGPQTDQEFSDSLVLKLFFFQAINSYNSFVYIGFFQGRLEGCPDDDCIGLLERSLTTTFLSLAIMSFVEMGLPYAKLRWFLRSERKALEKTMVKKGVQAKTFVQPSYMEVQAKMERYSMVDRIQDELEIVTL